MRLRLEFEVDYNPTGNATEGDVTPTMEELADRLANIAHRAMADGMLTGDTPATVESTHICVRDLETGECV